MIAAVPCAVLAWFITYTLMRLMLHNSNIDKFGRTLESGECATVVALCVGFVLHIEPWVWTTS